MEKNMKLIRLTSGEEIICKLTINKDDTYTITDGMMLIPAGEGKIGFMPFMAYSAGDPIVIDKKFVMFVTNPNVAMEDNIREMTTGIQVPKKGGIII